MAAINHAYVFAMTPTGATKLVGDLALKRSQGSFSYAESWLNYEHRYPIDPVNLPLQPGIFTCRHNGGVFPVFSDAGPDAWGTRIMLLHHKSQPANEIERLLRTSGHGVGSLRYSLSRTRPKDPANSNDISLLGKLHEAVEAVDGPLMPSEDQLRLVEPGSSMGGARPKVSLHDDKYAYLVKFSRVDDLVDVPRAEYATMKMLNDTALDVPDVRLQSIGGTRSAFLIQRFDRTAKQTTHHYISAHALFNRDRVRELPDGRNDPAGYVALARIIRGHSADAGHDGKQLFLRALTNVVIGNTDDHARNFGFRYDLQNKAWSLAPVFDVLPIVSSHHTEQAMSLGAEGRAGTWENLWSCHREFGLNEKEALTLANDHLEVLQNWKEYYENAGMTEKDLSLLDSIIAPRLTRTVDLVAGELTKSKSYLESMVIDNLDLSVDAEQGLQKQHDR